MTAKTQLSKDQRGALADLLQSRFGEMERQRASQLHGLSQAESARQTLLQDADDATQRSGTHEVEGSLADIDSKEFDAIRSALKRIHDASYGLCIDCQARIPFERLRAEPQALRCVACESVHERRALA
jgi:DnaK suppressor protein